MQQNSFTNIPFGSFYKKLQLGGFTLSVKTILEIENIILTKHYRGSKWKNKDLKYIIAPLIAKNKEEQKRVYKIIDEELEILLKHTPAYAPEDESDIFIRKVSKFFSTVKGRYVLVICFFIITLLLVAVITPTQQKEIITKAATKASTTSPLSDNITKISTIPSEKIELLIHDNFIIKQNEGFEIRAKNAIEPTIANVAIPVTVIFGILIGIILHFFVFYKRRKVIIEQNSDTTTQETLKDNDFNTAAPLAPTLQNKSLNKLNAGNNIYTKNFEQWQLPVLQKKLKEFATKTRSDYKEEQLHLPNTIKKTIQNAGFVSLQYAAKDSDSRIAVFLDDNESNTHLKKIAHIICDMMANELSIDVFTFNRLLHKIYDVKAGKHIKLHQLVHERKFRRAFIFSNANFFVDGYTQNTTKTIVQLNQYNITALNNFASTLFINITNNFSFLEQKNQINLYNKITFTSLNLSDLVSSFTSLSKGNKTYAGSIDTKPVETISDAKKRLSTPVFQTFCAMAVYPKLNFFISYQIFRNMLGKTGYFNTNNQEVEYNLFLELIQMPWFKLHHLPDDMREELLQHLTKENEIAARECILKILQNVPNNIEDIALTTLHSKQLALNNLLLQFYASDIQKLPQEKLKKLRTTLEESNEALLTRKIDAEITNNRKVVQKFIWKEELNISMARASILLIPPFIIYMALVKFKPHQVYNTQEGTMYNSNNITLNLLTEKNCTKWLKVYKESSVDVDINTDSTKQYELEKQYNDSILITYTDSVRKIEYQTKIGCTFESYEIKPTHCVARK